MRGGALISNAPLSIFIRCDFSYNTSMTEKKVGVRVLYQCGECGFHYEDKATAEKCEGWCRRTKSCNLDIVKEAVENRGQ